MNPIDDNPLESMLADVPDSILRTKAQWKELSIAQLTELTTFDWQQMPRSIFKLTPKKIKSVELALKKFRSMQPDDVAATRRSIAIIGLMYRNERDRRAKVGKL